jgi:hypothetical protein
VEQTNVVGRHAMAIAAGKAVATRSAAGPKGHGLHLYHSQSARLFFHFGTAADWI